MAIGELTEDTSALGEVEVSVSVIVLATTTEDVSSNYNVRKSLCVVASELVHHLVVEMYYEHSRTLTQSLMKFT